MLAKIEQLTKEYTVGFGKKVTAVRDVSYGIPAGSLTGIVGPNGSGKSTSLKALLGLIKPTSGSVSLFGARPQQASVFQRIGYLPENVALSDTLKSREILGYYAQMHGMRGGAARARIDQLLEQVGLAEHTRKTVRQYSKGMMQRLALAAALVHDPELVILDEPMSGLDPIGRRFVSDLLAEQHRAGKTICFSSHILHDIEVLCDRLVVIYKGKLVFEGAKEDFAHRSMQFRVVFAATTPPDVNGASALGPNTWELAGTYDECLTELAHLRAAGYQIIEFGRKGTLESSFFELVGS